ncbi:hypothetical protein DFJ74DRAFT_611225 [Hyaloraphidium curvatum]|nr:hypothetical protein DFJ74DRAFT_611225 [Hyaloraphidium curvatum]
MDEVGADVRDHNWLEPFRRANQTVVFEDDEHVWAYRFAENGYKPPWQKKTSKNRSNKPPGPRQPVTLGKYRGPLLNLTQLRADLDAHGDFRILHFGSVFGSDRVVMSSKRGLELAKAVEDAMLYANPVLHRLADGVVGKLGGRGSFLGLHLRIGEARGGGEMFSSKPDETIAAAVAELDAWAPEEAKEAAAADGAAPANATDAPAAGPASHPLSPYLPADPSTVSDPESLLEICKHLHATAKDPWSVPIVYVATDALDARNNPSFRALFDKYPCTFVLGDLMHQPSGLAKAKDVAFPDGRLVPAEVFTRRTAHLFVPLVDQIAVASGAHFVGTAKSTFSQYAARLHAHWIERGEHPMAPKRKGKRKD